MFIKNAGKIDNVKTMINTYFLLDDKVIKRQITDNVEESVIKLALEKRVIIEIKDSYGNVVSYQITNLGKKYRWLIDCGKR